jgi:nitroreductase
VAELRPDSDYVRQQLMVEAGENAVAAVMEAYRAFYESGDIAPWAAGQCQIAAAFMMLEAVHQQLATCPIGGFDERALSRAINMPVGETPALVLALGHCKDRPGPRVRRTVEEVISYL